MKELNSINIFKQLNESELEDLLNTIHFQIKNFSNDDVIAHKGANCENLKILISGSAHTEMEAGKEKIIKIADIKQGEIVAVSFLFGSQNIMPVNVIADEETKMLIIPKECVRKLIYTNQKVMDEFLTYISNQTQFLAKKIKFLNFNTIEEKILFFLKEQQKLQKEKEIVLPITHKKMAELFGVTRPSLSRAIKELIKKKKIEHISAKCFVLRGS